MIRDATIHLLKPLLDTEYHCDFCAQVIKPGDHAFESDKKPPVHICLPCLRQASELKDAS
jgi:hypothetical protein